MVPEFKWAENHENIFLTIEISDASEPKVEIKEDQVTFSATSQGKTFALDLKLKKKIDAAKSSFGVKGRDVKFLLVKQEADQGVSAQHRRVQTIPWSCWLLP